MVDKDETGDDLVSLMVAYQEGELEAFEGLYRVLAPKLRVYLLSLTRNPRRAEDLLQETFLQMHRSRETYEPPRPVKPWVFGIARHVFWMDRRAAGRRARHENTPEEELPELPVDGLAEIFPETDDLARALAEVSEIRREALLLHHVWGFSYREIASMLGISRSAAKVRAFRAMEEIREMLGQERKPT